MSTTGATIIRCRARFLLKYLERPSKKHDLLPLLRPFRLIMPGVLSFLDSAIRGWPIRMRRVNRLGRGDAGQPKRGALPTPPSQAQYSAVSLFLPGIIPIVYILQDGSPALGIVLLDQTVPVGDG